MKKNGFRLVTDGVIQSDLGQLLAQVMDKTPGGAREIGFRWIDGRHPDFNGKALRDFAKKYNAIECLKELLFWYPNDKDLETCALTNADRTPALTVELNSKLDDGSIADMTKLAQDVDMELDSTPLAPLSERLQTFTDIERATLLLLLAGGDDRPIPEIELSSGSEQDPSNVHEASKRKQSLSVCQPSKRQRNSDVPDSVEEFLCRTEIGTPLYSLRKALSLQDAIELYLAALTL